ncbi:MAG: YbaB/EbfC family nucleoid-associated protein [Chloroflexi bacterium]|nr:YbaB/EbfC family nucleoid-associated protein [Chloroflexota bacterium]
MNRDMLRQAQQLQARLAKIQEELETATVEASVGGGVVTVTMNGQQKVLGIKIAPEAVDPSDTEILQDLITAAVNEALEKSRQLAGSRLSAITGGLKIPGLM